MSTARAFHKATSGKKKKLAPFSLRLTEAEKARLLRRAKGQPLGAYIKSQLFKRKGASANKTEIATVLAILGSSDLARRLACIAKAAEVGALPVTDELEQELSQACADINTMRAALIRALGMRPK